MGKFKRVMHAGEECFKETGDASAGQRMSKDARNREVMRRPGADLLSWSLHAINVDNTLVLDFFTLSATMVVTPHISLVSFSLAGLM